MCLITIKRRARIAKRDITVYKVVRIEPTEKLLFRKNEVFIKAQIFSEIQNFPYKLNKLYETKLNVKRVPTGKKGKYDIEVEEGFHSWSKPRACHWNHNGDMLCVECVIPKGSKYYVGKHSFGTGSEDKGRVSNKIILKKILWPIIKSCQGI